MYATTILILTYQLKHISWKRKANFVLIIVFIPCFYFQRFCLTGIKKTNLSSRRIYQTKGIPQIIPSRFYTKLHNLELFSKDHKYDSTETKSKYFYDIL